MNKEYIAALLIKAYQETGNTRFLKRAAKLAKEVE